MTSVTRCGPLAVGENPIVVRVVTNMEFLGNDGKDTAGIVGRIVNIIQEKGWKGEL